MIKSKKIVLLIIGIILILCAIGCAFLMVNCIKKINYYNVNKEELYYKECKILRFEEKHAVKSGCYFEMIVEELDGILHISSISSKKINYQEFIKLESGDIIKIYYRESNDKRYDYDICEISVDNNVLLQLEDYMTVNKNNQKFGVGCCLFGIIDFLFLASVCFYHFIKLPKYEFLNNRN